MGRKATLLCWVVKKMEKHKVFKGRGRVLIKASRKCRLLGLETPLGISCKRKLQEKFAFMFSQNNRA